MVPFAHRDVCCLVCRYCARCEAWCVLCAVCAVCSVVFLLMMHPVYDLLILRCGVCMLLIGCVLCNEQ
jgi:hypothetical protein